MVERAYNPAEAEENLKIIAERKLRPKDIVIYEGSTYVILGIDGRSGLVELRGADHLVRPEMLIPTDGSYREDADVPYDYLFDLRDL